VCSSTHTLLHHQYWRLDLCITVLLARMHIEHELPEGALEPRQPFLQYNEPRTGQFGGELEIHLPKRLAQFKMLPRLEGIVAFFSKHVVFDICARVSSVRHFIDGHICN